MRNKANKVMGKGYALSAVIGILIGAYFGRIWLNIMVENLPKWSFIIALIGWGVLAFFAFIAIFIVIRITRKPIYWSGNLPRPSWAIWFVLLVITEIAFIVLGINFLQLNHLADWTPAWVLLVVGAHFFAFAYIFRIHSFNWLAASMCLTSISAVLVSSFFETDYLLFFLTGLSGAFSLWSFTAWALFRMAQSKWIDVK